MVQTMGGTAQAPQAEEKQHKSEGDDRKIVESAREEMRARRMEYIRSLDPALPASIEAWKQQFGPLDSQHILGKLYIWRGMLRSEYIALMNSSGDKWKNEEMIVDKCLLHPKLRMIDSVQFPAGLLTTLGDLILQSSGFSPDDPMPVRL